MSSGEILATSIPISTIRSVVSESKCPIDICAFVLLIYRRIISKDEDFTILLVSMMYDVFEIFWESGVRG